MTSNITPFTYDGQQVRVLDIEGEPWFVAADVARILSYRKASDMVRTVAEDEKGAQMVRTPGGEQQATCLTEAGLYTVILARQAGYIDNPEAKAFVKAFQRWVTHEVLPQIRKTGAYGTPSAPELTGPELLARAVLEATETLRRREAQLAAQAEQLAIVGPKADAFDLWLSSNVDYSVAAASQALVKAGAQNMGRNRLFSWLQLHKWVYRDQRGDLRPYQGRVDGGHLAVKLGSQLNTRTGELFATVTIRVTPKGLALLARRMDVAPALVAEAIQDEEGDVA